MKKYLGLFVVLLSVTTCCLFQFTSIDKKINDLFIKTMKPLQESEDVVIITVDDQSVEKVGTWPWTRDVMADTIVSMRELGAESVVFDLSYLDPSSRSADPDYIENELPGYIEEGFDSINETVGYIIEAFADGTYSSEDAEGVLEDFESASMDIQNGLQTNVSYVVKDWDKYLGDCLKFFGNSYLTLDFSNRDVKDEKLDADYLEDAIAIQNIDGSRDTKTPEFTTLQPALDSLLKQAKSAGFVNADPDKDGFRRRIHLVFKYNGKYYGQLVFIPLLNKFGNPEVVITDKNITLKNAKISETETQDIVIPRCSDGSVLVKFPKKQFLDYRMTNVWRIYQMTRLEKALAVNLETMNSLGFFWDFDEDFSPLELYQNAQYIREALYEGEDEDYTMDLYKDTHSEFFACTDRFLNGGYEETILEDYFEEDSEDWDAVKNLFKVSRNYLELLNSRRAEVAEFIGDAMCIVGTTATSTTDYANILYEANYPNVGVHSAVANMILAEDFLSVAPWWISIIIAIILCTGYALIAMKLSTGKSLFVGLGLLIVSALGLWAFFYFTKIYVGAMIPVSALTATFIATTIIGFITASHDKRFITNAFSQCLSKDVVNDIVANPSSLKLGGVSREMSAIFTDIQKFSGFSELLNAAELVALLNYYLTPMSDIIMEEGGMVDKYEGDAIVALVGAPLEMKDHAARACAAAIKMKKHEEKMNKEILDYAAKEAAPELPDDLFNAFKKMVANKRSIFTRIGINSGEMVAGFMGSENKKNYTMMGNNVNLASRLEGVNKQYSTGGILISEATRNLIGDEFIVRSLDRVQVVNVNTPMRLFELLETKEEASENLLKFVAFWEKAMSTFESGDYNTSLAMFEKCCEENPKDNVAKYYVSLVKNFFLQGKYPTKEDDFGVAYNNENPEDMDPSWVGTKYEIKGTFRLLSK